MGVNAVAWNPQGSKVASGSAPAVAEWGVRLAWNLRKLDQVSTVGRLLI